MAGAPALHDDVPARLRHGQGLSGGEAARRGALLPRRDRASRRSRLRHPAADPEDGLQHHLLDHLRGALRLRRPGVPRQHRRLGAERAHADNDGPHQLPAGARVPAEGDAGRQGADGERAPARRVRARAAGASSGDDGRRQPARLHRRVPREAGADEGQRAEHDVQR